MAHRSYSQVRSLRTCGEQYRLERVEQVAQRPGTAAIAGRVIHQATELVDYEIASGEENEDVLVYEASRLAEEILDREVEENLSPTFPTPDSFRSFGQSKLNPAGQDVEWFRKIGIPGSIQNYVTWRVNEVPHYELGILPSGELAIEVPFTLDLGGVEVVGQIDRVFWDVKNSFSVILDIKSGQKPKSNEQLAVYKIAMEEKDPSTPYLGSYVYGLKPGSKSGTRQTYPNVMMHWNRERLTAIYSQADKQIDAGLFIANPGESCFMCSVSHACPLYSASVV
jgi:hypothetical protein